MEGYLSLSLSLLSLSLSPLSLSPLSLSLSLSLSQKTNAGKGKEEKKSSRSLLVSCGLGAHQTVYLTQSQYTDTGPASPSADPITPGAWQGSHWSANFEVIGMTRPRKNPEASGNRTPDLPQGGALATVPTRGCQVHMLPH